MAITVMEYLELTVLSINPAVLRNSRDTQVEVSTLNHTRHRKYVSFAAVAYSLSFWIYCYETPPYTSTTVC